MSLRGRMLTLMAMTAMFGGTGMAFNEPRRYNHAPPRKLSPEEETEELERRKTKFLSELDEHNEERKKNFPKFKEHIVYDLTIIAFNQKNAVRDMNALMQSNHIQIQIS